MRKSIFLKIFCTYLLIVAILSSSILVFSFNTIRNHYIETLTHDLRNLGTSLLLKAAPLFKEKSFEELDVLVKRLGKDINTRITIINIEGVVVADSEKKPQSMENHRTRSEILQVLEGKVGTSLRFSTTVQEEMLYVALPIERSGNTVGVLRVSLYLKDINNLLGLLKTNIIYSALVIAFISLLGALIFTRSLSKPIRELTNASRKVASGDFNVRVFLKNRDELKELSDSFNYMTEQIRTLFTQLSLQKEQLNSIISSIQEGLFVCDKQGKIILCNESFKKIVQGSDAEGKYYWEVVREPQFGESIKKVSREKRNYIDEMLLHDKVFLCSITFLDSREEIVTLLYDITEMKNIEKIKKDFVVNVSHELRTPLTAIKGFVETLEEEDGEKNQHYVDIIKKHTDRLINIVKDLLALSQLEEKGTTLELEEVNLGNLIEQTFKIFEPRMREKHLKLDLNIESDIPPIKADSFKLEQALINLLDNAIKYTEHGTITLSLTHRDYQAVIKVTDTGIGIPDEHIPRIFERFYVVDKSHSRKLGGTGLGLSIVKHIVLLHNGTLDVKSIPGEGTTFSLTLPINPS